MVKRKDKFWRLYLGTVIVLAVLIAGVSAYFFTRGSFGDTVAGAVLGAHDEIVQGFEFVETPVVYKDHLSRGWENWSWDSSVDPEFFATTSRNKSIKVEFLKPNAGFMIHAPHFDVSLYKSIQISAYLKASNDQKFFIELTDANGNKIGSQLLSWYAENKSMEEEKWYDLLIPLSNLNAFQANLGDIAIISSLPTTIFIDDISFSTFTSDIPVWREEKTEIENDNPIPLPYKSDFFYRRDDWRKEVGVMETAYNKMRLETGSTTNYAKFNLKGGNFWSDYLFTVGIDWAMGDSVSLTARNSSDNYFSCSFFDDGANMTLYQIKNGESVVLESAPNFTIHRVYIWNKTQELGMKVVGDTISCLVNGDEKLKVKAKLPIPFIGGVGIELWSPEKGKNSMSVNKVIVEPVQ